MSPHCSKTGHQPGEGALLSTQVMLRCANPRNTLHSVCVALKRWARGLQRTLRFSHFLKAVGCQGSASLPGSPPSVARGTMKLPLISWERCWPGQLPGCSQEVQQLGPSLLWVQLSTKTMALARATEGPLGRGPGRD